MPWLLKQHSQVRSTTNTPVYTCISTKSSLFSIRPLQNVRLCVTWSVGASPSTTITNTETGTTENVGCMIKACTTRQIFQDQWLMKELDKLLGIMRRSHQQFHLLIWISAHTNRHTLPVQASSLSVKLWQRNNVYMIRTASMCSMKSRLLFLDCVHTHSNTKDTKRLYRHARPFPNLIVINAKNANIISMSCQVLFQECAHINWNIEVIP